MLDITNEGYGRLTALKEGPRDNSNKRQYYCKCQCGTEKLIRMNDLRSGKILSCGCLGKENRLKNRNVSRSTQPKPYKDLAGKDFGQLTVLSFDMEKTIEKNFLKENNKRGIWKCKCKCGNICYVDTSSLLNGHTQSCGCLISKGELAIKKLLIENNIPFECQKQFSDCILPSGFLAKFDFFINNAILVEYDGEQHFLKAPTSKNSFYTQEKIDIIHLNDEYKNQWCKEKGIKLIRIPYWEKDNISLSMLGL